MVPEVGVEVSNGIREALMMIPIRAWRFGAAESVEWNLMVMASNLDT